MSRSNLYAFLFTLLAFGFLVPYAKGLDFLDPILIVISCSIPLVFVAPMVATDNPVTRVRVRVLTAIVFASALAVLIAANSLVTVNLTHRLAHILLPRTALLAGILLLNVSAAAFLAMISAWMLQSMSPRQARRIVRVLFFVLLLAYVFVSRFAPENIRDVFDQSMTTEALTRNAWIVTIVLLLADIGLWRRAVRDRGVNT